VLTIVASLAAAPAAMAQTATGGTDPSSTAPVPTAAPAVPTGGAAYGQPNPATTQLTPEQTATLLPNGYAAAPVAAPQEVKDAIAAANRITTKPYRYGGGHGKWEDSGYDCSGSVSYALHGGGLLKSSMPSGSFMDWGEAGKGEWITLYAHGGHIYMVVAGLRFDTSGRGETGSRWQKAMRSPSGFTVRHPKGL
jgi:cell wall-associated NlpC family hydrolase